MTIWGNPFSTHVTRPDYAQTDETLADFIRNKPDAAIQKAQTTADNAKTAADNAKTAADAARAAAGAAQAAADNAQSTADGKVAQITAEIVLRAADWSERRQTVAVDGVTTISTVFISPALSVLEAFSDSEIVCVSQGNGTLTFRCEAEPQGDIPVNVVILSGTCLPAPGADPVPGENGGYYIPVVTQTEPGVVVFSYIPSDGAMESVPPREIIIPQGPAGNPPVKGKDYWTDADKAEIVEEVKNSGTEPAEEDIPKVFFGGPLQQTKTEATVSFRYISKTQNISGYAVIKAQGDSSMSYPKKNQTVKLYKDADCTEKLKVDFRGWGKQNKFVFKANWIDISHARNLVSARLWGDVVKSRGNYSEIPELLRTSPNQGAVDGFPVKVYAAGIYQGRYTLNIPKDGWMANMDDELDTHCILCGENSTSAQFKAPAVIDGSDWSDEVHDTVPASILSRWNEIISFVQSSTDADFKANIGNYFDVTSLIDYYLFGTAICDNDGFKKNQIYMTYDGQKWYASAYDKDSTFGLWWDASKFIAYDSEVSTIDENLLYSRLKSLFAEEIQTRWAELRKGALSEENIINRFERFTDICPPWLVAEDYAATTGGGAYTAIPQQGTNNIQQIRDFIVPRLAWADVKVVGDPTLLYKLKEPVTFSNANPTGVETGVKLFDTAKDATVFISYDVTSVIASATLLYTNTGTTDWYPPGMFISTSGEYIQLGVHKTTFKGAAAADYKHLMANVNAIAIVITAGMPTLVKFREKSGTIRTWGIPTGITFAATDGTLTLGAQTGNTQGLYTQGFDGTVKDFRVWNVAKTEAEINALFADIQS